METKFEISIDLGDLFSDEEMSIKEIVKKEIINSIIFQVTDRVKKQINEMLDVSIRESIDKNIGRIVREIMVKKFDENAEIQDGTYSKNLRPVKEVCDKFFVEALSRYNLEGEMKDYCKKIASELKHRYDLQFAALIVHNLKDQHLLADEKLAELVQGNNQ